MGFNHPVRRMKISIIIPAYNEEKRIGRTLEAHTLYFENIRKKQNLDYELLVVINNTTDNTESIVKQHIKKNSRIKYLNLKKGGKGYAVIEGFKEALKEDYDLIGFVDADLATSPEAFHQLIIWIKNNDGILANRYAKESKLTPSLNFRRIIVAKVFNFLVRSLFFMPYRDTQCGAKLFTKKAAQEIVRSVKMSQWAFDVELLYRLHKKNYQVKEIPTVWREVGGSKLNLKKSSIQMFLAITQLRIINSPFKKILKPLNPIIKTLWKKTL